MAKRKDPWGRATLADVDPPRLNVEEILRRRAAEKADDPPPTLDSMGMWTPQADKWLVDHADMPIETLGRNLRCTAAAVQSRLRHLRKLVLRQNTGATSAREPPAAPPPSELNAQQQQAFLLAQQGHSFFLTGGAGTGKSFTLGHVITCLKRRLGEDHVRPAGPEPYWYPAPLVGFASSRRLPPTRIEGPADAALLFYATAFVPDQVGSDLSRGRSSLPRAPASPRAMSAEQRCTRLQGLA